MQSDDHTLMLLDRELIGHKTSIECLAFSPDGRVLLSGDDDAVLIVWNLNTGEATQTIRCLYHGPVSAITWININDSSEPAFVFGCADGSLHLYKRMSDGVKYDFVSMETFHNGPIESVAFDPVHFRLASVGGGVPQVWKVSAVGTLTPIIKSEELRPVIARNVFFCDDGASIVVCYLESHEIICFSIEPWNMKWSKSVPTRIGNSFLCAADGLYIFVTNLLDGVDQYRFPSLEKVQSFPHAIETNHPLQISTTSGGNMIVCGGDSGFARVFSRRTGQLMQRLEHERSKKQITVVSANFIANKSTIATAESGEGDCKIRLWKEKTDENSFSKMQSARQAIHSKLKSGLTGMQVIALGLISVVVWHLLISVSRTLLSRHGLFFLAARLWHGFVKLASSLVDSYYSDFHAHISTTPSVVIVTQTSFATVTSVVTATTVTSTMKATSEKMAPSVTPSQLAPLLSAARF